MQPLQYDAAVFICRAQPFHNAHLEIIKRALDSSQKVIVIVGSANQPRTYKNPFTFEERKLMIRDSIVFDSSGKRTLNVGRLIVEPNIDTIYNDQAWASRVQKIVENHTQPNEKITLIGHSKDESSYYLKMFPQWKLTEVELVEPLNATDVRELYFKKNFNENFIRSVVPTPVLDYLKTFAITDEFKQIIEEREFAQAYRKQFEHLPWEPVFVTVDAVVVQSGHVLMVKRGAKPGKGLWALPGGFLDAKTDKSLKDAMLRELKEETKIKVPLPVLRGRIKDTKVFDAIGRSSRGRTITHAYKIVLPDGDLPRTKGGDDAEHAAWIPIAQIDPSKCFEDHFEIINYFLGH